MIKNLDSLQVTVNENMRGGDGEVLIRHISDKDEMHGKCRLYAHILLKKGCSVGYHVHENESELYHILTGTGRYDDNGETRDVHPGDTTVTAPGQGHSIVNTGEEDLTMMALIILE